MHTRKNCRCFELELRSHVRTGDHSYHKIHAIEREREREQEYQVHSRNHGLPFEEVIIIDRAGSDSMRRVP